MSANKPRGNTFRAKLHEIIFEADTRTGKAFDIVLLALIVISVILVMLESIEGFQRVFHNQFIRAEYALTFLFTIEYILRLLTVRKPLRYATSFFGVVDLLAILPSYITLIFPGGFQSLMTIRALRLLRLFRIFKLARYVQAYRILLIALRQARPKIIVFIIAVVTIVIFVGSLMYIVEHGENGFDNIPVSIYWAIVTVTTVGYGDISPQSDLGRAISAVLMIIGYAIIAVPTGIVSAEIAMHTKAVNTQSCPNCSKDDHRDGAIFCYDCGEELNPNQTN